MSKFADDTKWGRIVEDEEDQKTFQDGLNSLMKWSQDWQIDLNVKKCHIMNIGPKKRDLHRLWGARSSRNQSLKRISEC